MSLIKRRKDQDQPTNPSPVSSQKLFVDYPYPIITELVETYERREKSVRSHSLTSLKWYKNSLHKLFGQSIRRSSQADVNDLHNQTKSADIEQHRRLRGKYISNSTGRSVAG